MDHIDSTRVVAAFDFDGTLSTRDNVVPFLLRIAGTRTALGAAAASGWRVVTSSRADRTRDALKAEIVRRVFAGRVAAAVDDLGREFAADIVRRHLRADAVARAEWHREQGHRVVIVSASFGVYLRPVAQHLELDGVLATELEVDDHGRLSGSLAGANVRGAEKAHRLDQWIRESGEPAFVWAYGNDSGDRELWAWADRPVKIGRRAWLRVSDPA